MIAPERRKAVAVVLALVLVVLALAGGTVLHAGAADENGSDSLFLPVIVGSGAGGTPRPRITPVPGCAGVTQIPIEECNALVVLYNATNGPEWKDNRGWLAHTEPCRWFGVGCAPGAPGAPGHVRNLYLSDNRLLGEIPSELGDLHYLEILFLNDNRLTGTIPAALGNLGSLEELNLHVNRLTGSIPTELGNLRSLKRVLLYNNELTGPIPAELGNLSSLQSLYLEANDLTGSIPAELGNLGVLERLNLHANELTGSIPAELGNLRYLEELTLYRNELTGPIPSTLTALIWLDMFNFSETKICVPDDPAIAEWFAGIQSVSTSDITCTSAPVLNAIDNADGDGDYTVSWSADDNATSYALQEAVGESFINSATVYTGTETAYDVTGKAPGTYYYRVNAENESGPSLWSNVESIVVMSNP